MLIGVACAAAGLVMGTGAKMALPLFKSRRLVAPLIALVTFASIGLGALADLLCARSTCAGEHCHRLVDAAMNDDTGTLLTLAGYFALMSLFAIGGANSAVPEMYRMAVEIENWMTDRQFADMFAIAQVTPGPNVIIVALIGYHVAGLIGALVALLAMCGPTCVFAFYVGQVWERFKDAPLAGRDPGRPASDLDRSRLRECFCRRLGDGAKLGSRSADAGTAIVTYITRLNPLWIFAAAAMLGLAGVL